MFDVGFWELLLIGIVALLVVGPERLPKFARVTGMWIGRAQASIRSVKNDISRELRAEELKESLNEPFQDLPGLNDLPDLKDIIEMEAEDELRAAENDASEPKTNG
jgi:sec-independent protein translocase protein TatB